MAPRISYAKTTLSCPLYAADFSPYNPGYLVVGGGGGPGRSGVGNKIFLLDVSSRASIETLAEIDLSRDEDSVSSLANLASKDGLITYAGINSPESAKVNEHFRSFEIRYPRKSTAGQTSTEKDATGQISLLGKASLFASKPSLKGKSETYQRCLRLSAAQKRASGSKRIGAIATGLAPEGEIVVFDATTSSPTSNDIIQRINPPKGAEANDVDIIELSEGEFMVGYCTDHEVRVSRISYDFSSHRSTTPPEDPRTVYIVPFPDTFEKPGRAKLRTMRFITPHHILLLSNLSGKRGAELLVLRLFDSGAPPMITMRKRLPRHVKAAVGMDVCALDADPDTGACQYAVAIAGQDISITIYTLEYHGIQRDTLSKFRLYTVLKDVHPLQMTKLVFAPFHSPWPSPEKSTITSNTPAGQQPKLPPPQYLRLASISMGNTVVVDALPLRPLHPKRRGSRYVLPVSRGDALANYAGYFIAASVLLVMLVLAQPLFEAWGVRTGGVRQWVGGVKTAGGEAVPTPLGEKAREKVNVDVPDAAVTSPVAQTPHRIRDLLHHLPHHPLHTPPSPDSAVPTPPAPKALLIRAADDPSSDSDSDSDSDSASLTPEIHADAAAVAQADARARRWEELSAHERERWKARLIKAGRWAVGEGEAVLKGVFFSEYAGVVGEAFGRVVGG